MRDPDGRLEFRDNEVLRHVSPHASALAFLHDAAAARLSSDGMVVPFEFVQQHTLRSPRYSFVSYPFEWCDAQLHKAGAHTIAVAREALRDGYEIKDASAWNVVFDGAVPLFCDHLSFEKISRKQWWAFGQFARHFLFPLAISRHRGLKAHESFMVYRDGVPVEKARSMLGPARFIDRTLPLYLAGGRSSTPPAGTGSVAGGATYHKSILDLCEWMLGGTGRRVSSRWTGYTEERSHYTAEASTLKRDTVRRWLEKIAPAWVLDLGCNTGEFAKVAMDAGARVIAADVDHDSVQRLFLEFDGSRQIHPVVMNLGDMLGGKGFAGEEFPGFLQRGRSRADVVMMLALIHHLMISEGIGAEKIAEFASRLSRKFLIVELVGETDPMARLLASQRNRDISQFSIELQLLEFGRHFEIIESHEVAPSGRRLALMSKKGA